MGRTSFYVVRMSSRALSASVLTLVIIGALIMYGALQQRVTEVSNEAVRLDEPAPEFTLLDTSGNTFDRQTWQDKGLVLVFWTTWCPGCADDLQMIEQVHRQLSTEGGVVLVGINMMEDAATVSRFAVQHGLGFPTLLDIEASVSNAYGIRIVPSVLVIDRYGFVRERMLGRIDRDTFSARLQPIIPAEQP